MENLLLLATMLNLKPPKKPWDSNIFKLYRPEIYDFCNGEIIKPGLCAKIMIEAPVKSGKRELVECLSVLLPQYRHIFISSFHRLADEDQREEFKKFGIIVYSINNESDLNKCKMDIQGYTGLQMIHLDEFDYGSGEKQLLSGIWNDIKNDDLLIKILYSATPQEFLFSDECKYELINTRILEYIPPSIFCGPGTFLKHGLVYDAKPAIECINDNYTLSPQFSQIIKDFEEQLAKGSKRNIIHLRLSSYEHNTKKTKGNKMNYLFLEHFNNFLELSDYILLIDKGEKFDVKHISRKIASDIEWSNKTFWDDKSTTNKYILINDQTATRSTELACHDRLFCVHSFKNSYTFTIASQELERYNHYTVAYNGEFQPIRIYGDIKTSRYSSGEISYQDFMTPEWKSEKHPSDKKLFKIVSKIGNDHPEYDGYLDKNKIGQILINLHSNPNTKLSPRTSGKIRSIEKIDTYFKACNSENYHELPFVEIHKNPFIASKKRMEEENYIGQVYGFLRVWKVLDFDFVEENKGWGMTNTNSRVTICYKDNVLGVAYREHTGEIEIKDTITTKKSMYR